MNFFVWISVFYLKSFATKLGFWLVSIVLKFDEHKLTFIFLGGLSWLKSWCLFPKNYIISEREFLIHSLGFPFAWISELYLLFKIIISSWTCEIAVPIWRKVIVIPCVRLWWRWCWAFRDTSRFLRVLMVAFWESIDLPIIVNNFEGYFRILVGLTLNLLFKLHIQSI